MHSNHRIHIINSMRHILVLITLLCSVSGFGHNDGRISLLGEWRFQLDEHNQGLDEGWYNRLLEDRIQLPGTTDEACKGRLDTVRHTDRLSRVYPYYGAAWYQKTVRIPEDWLGKHITLLMERTKSTCVWVDSTYIDSKDGLASMQRYDLSQSLTPGTHRITVCVNNAKLPPIGDPHQISDQTQTNWNGIVGRIVLTAQDPIWMEDVQVYPDIHAHCMRVRIKFGNSTGKTSKAHLTASAYTWNTAEPMCVPAQTFACTTDTTEWQTFVYHLGDKLQLWDEFTPTLYRLRLTLEVEGAKNATYNDSRELDIGMREFIANGTQFAVNGKTIFLRGKHDACVFPLTGYAPMEVAEWKRIFEIAKSYGLNHYRFHTWCPPAAAFEAADIVGIYMQPELPQWSGFGDVDANAEGDVELRVDSLPKDEKIGYALKEGCRIMHDFGNHASFTMFALGNELFGSRDTMKGIVAALRAYDNRHLYAQGSNNHFTAPSYAEGDDYWTTTMTGGHYSAGNYAPDTQGKDVRASYPVYTVGHINNLLTGTMYDFGKSLEGIKVPVIGHETGQYGIYPNYDEMRKYTGVLRPRNLETFRERLREAGMLDQAGDFFRASGALAAICYREEIETALRTPGMGGFQLLDLQDFPGQGTALVGILDAFMDSKGLIEPSQWRQFCSAVVPLVRMEKFVWEAGETFHAAAETANYGADSLPWADVRWLLRDEAGGLLACGRMDPADIPQGGLTELGSISFPLPRHMVKAGRLTLTLQVDKYENTYPLWVFPSEKKATATTAEVTNRLDAATLTRLERGGTMLFFPDQAAIRHSVPGTFQTDFWTYCMFKKYKGPGTMGMLCNPKHPALADFPTDCHSDWQWWRLLRNNPAMVLDSLPADLRPIIQVVDHFDRNHKLGVLFEARVGEGRLLVCSLNLPAMQELPEAHCLLNCLLRYAESDDFHPCHSVCREELQYLFETETYNQ